MTNQASKTIFLLHSLLHWCRHRISGDVGGRRSPRATERRKPVELRKAKIRRVVVILKPAPYLIPRWITVHPVSSNCTFSPQLKTTTDGHPPPPKILPRPVLHLVKWDSGSPLSASLSHASALQIKPRRMSSLMLTSTPVSDGIIRYWL